MTQPGKLLAVAVMATLLSGCAQSAGVSSSPPDTTVTTYPNTPTTTNSEPPPTRTHATLVTATPITTAVSKHPSKTVATNPQPPFSTSALKPVRLCKARDLVASGDFQQGRGYRKATDPDYLWAADITLTSRSTTPCTVSGWVGFVTFGTIFPIITCPVGASPCPPQPTPDTVTVRQQPIDQVPADNPPTILLRHGETASFSVLTDNTGTACLEPPYGVHLRVQGDDQPIDLVPVKAWQAVVCGNISITALGIRG